jgi:hypothetical protein
MLLRRGGEVAEEVDDGAGEDVGFDVDAVADAEFGEGGFFEGGGDDGEGEGAGADLGDGHGDAIDGDGALGDEEGRGFGGDLEGEAPVAGVGAEGGDGADGIDVALDKMAADEGVGAEGEFEVDAVAGGFVAEGGTAEGFGDGVEGGHPPRYPPTTAGYLGDREADAGDADGVAEGDGLAGEFGEGDGEAFAGGGGGGGLDGAEGLDDACKHTRILPQDAAREERCAEELEGTGYDGGVHKGTRCERAMKGVRLTELQGNAYRVLGVPAMATQAEIEAAARLMRVMEGGAANEAEWMGPLKRPRADIEKAVVRLSHPKDRLRERVWWFGGKAPRSWPAASELLKEAERDQGQTPALAHDAMLVRLWRTLLAEEKATVEMWREVLREAGAVARSRRYEEWMTAVEQYGDFEKRATAEEIAAVQEEMGQAVAETVADLGEEALQRNELGKVEKGLALLGEAGADGAAAQERLLAGIDGVMAGACHAAREDIGAAWDRRDGQAMAEALREMMRTYTAQIERMMRMLLEYWRDAGRRERLRGTAAGLLEYGAQAHEAMYDQIGALAMLVKALEAAKGTTLERRIRERHDRLEKSLHYPDQVAFQRAVDDQSRKNGPDAAQGAPAAAGTTKTAAGESSGGGSKSRATTATPNRRRRSSRLDEEDEKRQADTGGRMLVFFGVAFLSLVVGAAGLGLVNHRDRRSVEPPIPVPATKPWLPPNFPDPPTTQSETVIWVPTATGPVRYSLPVTLPSIPTPPRADPVRPMTRPTN